MIRKIAICLAVLLALAGQASAYQVTVYLDKFNGTWVNSSVGQVSAPDGAMSGNTSWLYNGHGSVTTRQETNIIPVPALGESALRFNLPGSATGTGMAASVLFNTSQRVTKFDIDDMPIDYTKPIFFKADVYGVCLGGTKMETRLQTQSVDRIEQAIDWTTAPNGVWTTITTELRVNDFAYFDSSSHKTKVCMTTFFDNPAGYDGQSYVIWDNLRMEYSSTVPEPGSILALATGMLGLAGLIRRKR